MNLSTKQVQELLDNFSKKPEGNKMLLEFSLNALMRAEREMFLEKSQGNKGNGFRSVKGFGIGTQIDLHIPRDRMGLFKPVVQMLWQNQQSHLDDLIFELYGAGLTTRDLERIVHQVYGNNLSRTSISRITNEFSQEMKDFRERELDEYYPIIYADALFLKVKRDTVATEAFYIVLGVKPDTSREVLGIYNCPTESAGNWEDIILDLRKRKVSRVSLFVIGGLIGFDKAIEKSFPNATIQKCVVHLKRNILNKVRTKDKEAVASDLKAVFNMSKKNDNLDSCLNRLSIFASKWSKVYAHIKKLPEKEDISYYFSYIKFEPEIWRMIYTTNWIERLNKDFKRTTRMRNSMPSVESALTLLSKVAVNANMTKYRYQVTSLKADPMFQ